MMINTDRSEPRTMLWQIKYLCDLSKSKVGGPKDDRCESGLLMVREDWVGAASD